MGIVVATFVAGGAVGATALRARFDDAAANRSKAGEASQRVASQPAPADSAQGEATPIVQVAAPVAAAPQPASTGTPPAPPPSAAAPFSPMLPMGQSTIHDSVTALRTDSNVVVSFDLLMVRTRRSDKFEQFVRATLPVIYGAPAVDALAKIPNGGLASQGELLTELPSKGMRIPLGTDWTLLLYPETRDERDGPLVVRYRVSVVPYGH